MGGRIAIDLRQQQFLRHAGKRNPGDPSSDRQQQGLRQHLRHQFPAPGPKRSADRQLPAPAGRPRQQQIGGVGQRNQEHQHGGAHQNQQRHTRVIPS